MKNKLLLLFCLFPLTFFGQVYKTYSVLNDRLSIEISDGLLDIIPLSDNAIRIQVTKESLSKLEELVFTKPFTKVSFKISEDNLTLKLSTKSITLSFNKQSGKFSFADGSGKVFLNELAGSRKLTPGSVMGEQCVLVEQGFESPADEYIFGLGQFQDGHYNLKGVTRRLTQVNSQISIPFIYSSKGYGLLWHQYGLTDFNPNDNFVTFIKQELPEQDISKIAEVTTTSGTQKISQNQSLYRGSFNVPGDGVYSIFLDLGDMDNRHYVAIDGKPCIDFSNFWLPPAISTFVTLKTGRHNLQLICKSSNKPNVSWRLKENITTFRSPNAKLLDYVVFYGPSADSIIAAYRNLTGGVPLLPQWAYGFWQCRERYSSGKQLVQTVKEFRRKELPMDIIVQDWQYWGNKGWGVPIFAETNYANPTGFIKEIHDLHAHFNISIWSNPDRNSTLGKEYAAKNLYIPDSKWLDYFNPVTRVSYWNTLNNNLFIYDVDSWWMDATEPENDALKGTKTYLGLGDFYRLTYPLLVNQAFYEGQRKTTSDKRVCILTRSAFLGQQRYSTTNWSGDIGGTWKSYKKQIVAGLNYSITGLPYWTTDIGGFFRPGSSQYTDKKYHELLIRWFQWGAFNPIFRIHGYQSETEPWKYGQQVEDNMRKMLNLRYRLIPYIYSEAWQVTKNGSTLMRPLVMDFNGDTTALNRSFEYLFGKAFLVAPITEPNISEWDVYLPESTSWYDFWSGEQYAGVQTIKTSSPLDKIPLYVKAGTILPMGRFIQYAGQKPADTLEIRIYQGANGAFTLYEDENDNYNYENGIYSTISFSWNDVKKTLTISDRMGSFPEMPDERKFNIVLVSKNKGTGMDAIEKYD